LLHDPGAQPLLDEPHNSPIPDPMLDELHQPFVRDGIEKATNVGIEHPVHLLRPDRGGECIQRMMLAAPGPKSVREAHEVLLIDRVHHLDHRALDDLIFHRRDAERSLSTVGLRDVRSP
jgi:hypothetical protein